MTFNDIVKKQRESNISKSDIDIGQLKMTLSDISSKCFDMYVDTYRDLSDFANIIQDMIGQIERAQMILVRVGYGSDGGDIL